MVLAIQEYAIVFRLRNDWKNFHANNASGSYANFVQIEEVIGRAPPYSVSQVDKFVWLIAQSTTGTLNQAWVAAGRPSPN